MGAQRTPAPALAAVAAALLAVGGVWGVFAPSALPYLIAMAAAPLLAVSGGLATGGLRFHRSGTPEIPEPSRGSGEWSDWHEVEVFRLSRALRDGALAAAFAVGGVGIAVFAAHLIIAETPHPGAVLTLLLSLLVAARFSWAALRRTWALRLDEARLFVQPARPAAGEPFRVRVVQSGRVAIRGFDVILVADRTEITRRGRRIRLRTRRLHRDRAQLAPPATEHVFTIPDVVVAGGHLLRWRVELRTRIAGPDYRTRFLFPVVS